MKPRLQTRVWGVAGISVLLGVCGQLLFRRFGLAQGGSRWPQFSDLVVPNQTGWLVAAILCYVTAVVLWVKVLQHLPLSRAYPLQSLAYPLVFVGAIGWLGETMTLTRLLGTGLVCLGVALSVRPRQT